MISIIITSFKEPGTIGRAIEAFLKQNLTDFELIVSAPDEETLDIARKYAERDRRIKIIKDAGKGKPNALNEIFKIARGNFLVLSDGDVYVSKNSVENLLKHFDDKTVGAVTGRVVSTNEKANMLGFWAYLLTEGFHNLREINARKGGNIICSGYLYAIRNGLVKRIPEKILADDAFISVLINKKGYRTVYEPKAEVYVRYPDNLIDWIKQKKRTAGRIYQLNKYFKMSKLSSFFDELTAGMKTLMNANSLRKVYWFSLLAEMRLYIWFRVFFDFRLWNRGFKKTWLRTASTKQ